VGVVDESVEDGVGDGGVTEGLVPLLDGQLAGDDGGATPGAILDDLEEVGSLLVGERLHREVIELLRHPDNSIYPDPAIIPIAGSKPDAWRAGISG
jgi:hypothetical protein